MQHVRSFPLKSCTRRYYARTGWSEKPIILFSIVDDSLDKTFSQFTLYGDYGLLHSSTVDSVLGAVHRAFQMGECSR